MLGRAAVVAALMLALVGSAGAGRTHRLQRTGARLIVGGSPVEVTTARAIPRNGSATVYVSFNGQAPQASWSDSHLQIEYGWHGVLLVVTAHSRSAPATLRAVSTRADRVRVYVRFAW